MPTSNTNATHASRLIDASPVFYGWVILGVGAIAAVMTSPGQTYAVSVFIDHFIADLDISRSLVSTLYTVGTLTASFALPFVGRQIDRRGPRLMMTVITLFFGLACIYMGFVRSAVMLGIGFVALRMLGQGSLSLVSTNVINQWWVRRRGLAMGIAGVVTALLGGGGFPNLINTLIPRYGWSATYILLGLSLLLVMVPLAAVFIRNRPEDFGLEPDGVSTRDGRQAASDSPLEDNWTLGEATHTRAFWLISAGMASMSMLITGLTFHIFSIFSDSGLDASIAAAVFVPIAATGAIVQLGGGVLIDRIPANLLLAAALFCEALILIMAPFLFTVPLAIGFGLLMGAASGLEMTVGKVIWAKYYGRRHLGSITGVAITIMVAASALGPMPMGIARDLLGSYEAVLIGFAVLPVVLGLANLMFSKPPQRAPSPAVEPVSTG